MHPIASIFAAIICASPIIFGMFVVAFALTSAGSHKHTHKHH